MKPTKEEKWLYAAALAMLLCSIALGGYAFWLATGVDSLISELDALDRALQKTTPQQSEILK